MRSPVNADEVNRKLRALMARPDGVQVFMSKLTSPLRTKRDLVSGLRKVLQYDPLGTGDVPVYDLDPNGYAYMVPNQGAAPVRVQPDESQQITIRTYDMIAYKEYPISQLRIARYDYLKRIETQLHNALIMLEDTELYKVLEAVCTDAAFPLTPGTVASGGTLTPAILQKAYAQIENYCDPKYILGSATVLGDMRTWGIDIYSPVRREAILKTGVIGYVWNTSLYKSRAFPTNRVWITGDPELVGRIPERMALEPLRTDAPRKGKQEVAFIQNLGVCAYNGLAVNHITFA